MKTFKYTKLNKIIIKKQLIDAIIEFTGNNKFEEIKIIADFLYGYQGLIGLRELEFGTQQMKSDHPPDYTTKYYDQILMIIDSASGHVYNMIKIGIHINDSYYEGYGSLNSNQDLQSSTNILDIDEFIGRDDISLQYLRLGFNKFFDEEILFYKASIFRPEEETQSFYIPLKDYILSKLLEEGIYIEQIWPKKHILCGINKEDNCVSFLYTYIRNRNYAHNYNMYIEGRVKGSVFFEPLRFILDDKREENIRDRND